MDSESETHDSFRSKNINHCLFEHCNYSFHLEATLKSKLLMIQKLPFTRHQNKYKLQQTSSLYCHRLTTRITSEGISSEYRSPEWRRSHPLLLCPFSNGKHLTEPITETLISPQLGVQVKSYIYSNKMWRKWLKAHTQLSSEVRKYLFIQRAKFFGIFYWTGLWRFSHRVRLGK